MRYIFRYSSLLYAPYLRLSRRISTTSSYLGYMENQTRMIQNLQKIPQELQSLAPEAMNMLPLSASNTQNCLFNVKSLENSRKSLVTVSTTLCLYDETWPCGNPKKRKRNIHDPEVSCRASHYKLTQVERKIARMRFLSDEEKAEEERFGVSSELTLFNDPWIIKKVLTTSDLGQLSRLLLQASTIENHIIKYLSEDDKNSVQQGPGIMVNIYDHNTHSTLELLLKRWTTLKSYVLNGGWRLHFVRRRGLRKGDEIGLFWDRFASKLHFRVLSRAATEGSVDQNSPNSI